MEGFAVLPSQPGPLLYSVGMFSSDQKTTVSIDLGLQVNIRSR